ncbi:hypothetical protein PU11_17460 [Escherichia coli]|uniref:hypothetical protein n=1 Tax=Escherichia coli TaxID=562 RepID=UPI000544238D|nr:hypothetical protein [Escherichia coli]KHH88742.1 hypothetical protein PU46_24320 [Escherichia coli]KHI98286.1 hypothetical protein PU11_17460 [Escherichia coli]MCQ8758797.1 hypothetical protein [Escherichia coli]OEM34349.1 hypothetical protein BHF20_01895 [Escherichia coli]GCN85576.1 hypothetical protein BvCms2805_01713 [Escherichia coli]
MSDTYLNMIPKFKPSQETLDKKSFDDEMNKTADRVIELIPDLLADIIDGEAERLADLVPEVLRKPDLVTREVFDEKACRRFLSGKIANKLGRGLNWLNK